MKVNFLKINEINFYYKIIEQFKSWKRKKIKIIFYDTTDSSSWIKSEIIEFVDKYAKGQLLKNKDLYLKKIYGNRLYANYYYKNKKVKDKNSQFSKPIKQEQLKKNFVYHGILVYQIIHCFLL